MKKFLILPFFALVSCAQVKKTSTTSVADTQLLKDVEILSSDQFEGRKAGSKGMELARAYLINRLKEVGVQSYPSAKVYEQVFEIKGQKAEGKNLIGYISGNSDSVIVISAHYDHLGKTATDVYNGADDNASGVAGLLQIAQHFAKNKPNNTLIFALFDAEEVGLQGSKFFVKQPPVPLKKIKLNVNMDMISRSDKKELYVCGTFKYPNLNRFLFTTNPNIKLLTGHDDPKLGKDDWTNQSDQGSFNDKNIPFLYFGVEDHKDYHRVTDEYKNINKAFFTDAVNVIEQVISNIDKNRDLQSIFKEKLRMKQ